MPVSIKPLVFYHPPSSFKSLCNQYHKLIPSPKKSTTPALYLQPPTTPNVFGRQSKKLLHRRSSPLLLVLHLQTALLLFSQAKYPNSVFHWQPCYIISALTLSSCHSPWFLGFHSFLRIPSPQDPVQLSKQAISFRSHPQLASQRMLFVLVPTITNIVNLCLTSGQFHPTLKESLISLRLKKPTLDKEELSNYWPILNLSLISKIIEHVIKSHLMDHLTSNR